MGTASEARRLTPQRDGCAAGVQCTCLHNKPAMMQPRVVIDRSPRVTVSE